MKFHIPDMSCGHCTVAITKEIAVLDPAAEVSTDLDARTLILGAAIGIWAGRLGGFLFRRVKRDGGDGRFDKLKKFRPT